MASKKKTFSWPILIALFCLGVVLWWFRQDSPQTITVPPGDYLFCFWNVENLFDDEEDGHASSGDQRMEDWYRDQPQDLQLKLKKLTEGILKLNNGKGPDILALCEVENPRAAELLRQALNDQLEDESLDYKHLLMKEVKGNLFVRNVAPVILTRLPVVKDRTKLLDYPYRIMEGRIKNGDRELIIIVSHWRSRIVYKKGDDGEESRIKYANKIYGRFKEIYKNNPKIDLLVCGDFNDNPDDPSVTNHLRATGDQNLVMQGGSDPYLFNLFAGKNRKEFGTHYHKEKGQLPWHIFDQIVVSPGMLDNEGWSCDPNSVRTFQALHEPQDSLRRPWSFGSRTDDPKKRGYSDHFPVTVTLSVN